MSNPQEREDLARNFGLLRERAEQYYRRALQAFYANDFENAVLDVSEAIYLDRNYAEYYAARGLFYHADFKYQDANADFLYALKLKRDLWIAHYGLGLLAFQNNEYAQAEKFFGLALQYSLKRPEVQLYHAVTLYYLGNDVDARAEMELAIKWFAPDDKRLKEAQQWLKEFGGKSADDSKGKGKKDSREVKAVKGKDAKDKGEPPKLEAAADSRNMKRK